MARESSRFAETDWLQLGADEEVLWAGHPSIIPYFPRYLLGGVLVVGGTLGAMFANEFRLLAVAVVGIGVLLAGSAHYRRISTGYVITTTQVYYKDGLVSRDVTQIRYDRVQNTSFSQSIPERFFSYGDVVVTSAGTGEIEITFRNVPDPARIKHLLAEQLDRTAHEGGSSSHGPRSSGDSIENIL